MSTAPSPTNPPAHPVLRNLLKLLEEYGPLLLNWLISSGILKLPPGVTLPPLPTLPGAALQPSAVAQLQAIDVEIDTVKLADYLQQGTKLLAQSLSA